MHLHLHRIRAYTCATTIPQTTALFAMYIALSCHLMLQEKNVSSDTLRGKVGRIYMPKQSMDTLGLSKYKGIKRERRQSAREAAEARKRPKQTVETAVNSGAAE